LDHKVWIKADSFTPTGDDLIPTGELRDVGGTPMDFRSLKRIGDSINDNYEPLRQAGGYDHNYVLNISQNEVEKVAELVDEASGRVMEVFTDKPGLQLYTSNMLGPVENGKDAAVYGKHTGVCFETQYFPNACNIESFPSSLLKAGQEYEFVTIYKFNVKN
jgi:aldose 1-epimerase